MAAAEEPKILLCLSSDNDDDDDDDDDDEDLLNGSFLIRRRKNNDSGSRRGTATKPTAVVNATGGNRRGNNKNNSNNDNDRLMTAGQYQRQSHNNTDNDIINCENGDETKAQPNMEPCQRRPRWKECSSGAVQYSSNDNYDSDDEEKEGSLEVLPAKQRTPPHTGSFSSGQRLSFSGQRVNDPLALDLDESICSPILPFSCERKQGRYRDDDDDDDDDDDVKHTVKWNSSINDPLLSSDASPPTPAKVVTAAVAVKPPANAWAYEILSSPEQQSLSSACTKRPGQEQQQPESQGVLHSKPADRLRVPSPLLSPSTSSGVDNSDDDDSFDELCRKIQQSRKRTRRASKKINITIPKQTRSNKAKNITIKCKENHHNDNDTHKSTSDADKQSRREGKEREKQVARQRKEREKQIAREQKKRDRLAKQQAKQEAKRQRQENRQQSAQVRGRFANQEIGILAEPSILDTTHGSIGNSWKVRETLAEAGFMHVHPYPSGLACHTIQFIRQEYVHGGASRALEELMRSGPRQHGQATIGYEQLNLLAVVLEAPTFIDMIRGGGDNESSRGFSDDDDYPELEQWLFGLVAGWRAAWNKTAADRPRIILLLYQVPQLLDRYWVQYNRNGRNGSIPPNTEQFHDAILWMLIQFQVESIHCSTPEDVGHEIFKMTRLLAERPYIRQATDLQTFAKLPAHVSDMAPSFDRARDTWIRQLQQIPRVSADMAYHVSQRYPTAMALWRAYQDEGLSEQQKQLLLADCFGTQSSQVKLSAHVYRAITSDNPHEILH